MAPDDSAGIAVVSEADRRSFSFFVNYSRGGSSCSSAGTSLWETYLLPTNDSWTASDGWLIAANSTGDNLCVNTSPGAGTTHASVAVTYYYTATHP